MLGNKKGRSEAKNKACFYRTTTKTGKWRGKKSNKYTKYVKNKQIYHDFYYISYIGNKKKFYLVTRERFKEIKKAGDRIINYTK